MINPSYKTKQATSTKKNQTTFVQIPKQNKQHQQKKNQTTFVQIPNGGHLIEVQVTILFYKNYFRTAWSH